MVVKNTITRIQNETYDEATKSQRVKLIEGDVTINPGDIQIGAVEIKNKDTEDRVVVDINGNLHIIDFTSLVPKQHDELSLTYVTSGNGVGEIETVTYKLQNVIVAVLTLSYDINNNLINVVRS